MKIRAADRPLISASIVLGVGLGGFADGIVFHQILQLHNMLSARRPPTTVANLETNMVWDGLFHAATWLATALGIWLLFRAARQPSVNWSAWILIGGMLGGWGLFNLVEGVIDHHVLHVHHVVERLGVSVWDYVFLSAGVIFLLLGGSMIGLAGSPSGQAERRESQFR